MEQDDTKYEADVHREMRELLPESTPRCYQCDKHVNWLDPEGRCCRCSRMTPEEI